MKMEETQKNVAQLNKFYKQKKRHENKTMPLQHRGRFSSSDILLLIKIRKENETKYKR